MRTLIEDCSSLTDCESLADSRRDKKILIVLVNQVVVAVEIGELGRDRDDLDGHLLGVVQRALAWPRCCAWNATSVMASESLLWVWT